MTDGKKRLSLVKPQVTTPFHIDFAWWQQNDRSWRVYLRNYLSVEDQQSLGGAEDELFDLVDPETAEVHQVDALQHLLITRYANQEGFITHSTTVTESIFRLLLANGNAPMTPNEMGEKLGRPADVILRTLTAGRVYKGVRPFID